MSMQARCRTTSTDAACARGDGYGRSLRPIQATRRSLVGPGGRTLTSSSRWAVRFLCRRSSSICSAARVTTRIVRHEMLHTFGLDDVALDVDQLGGDQPGLVPVTMVIPVDGGQPAVRDRVDHLHLGG
jgi:hypothetical protein